ncbi:AlpA family transcriptional regulator [Shigella flexneri]|uniref:AlpA family transcriptional regulator n=35 Tax=root TaxID=1 RepID=A0AAI8E4E9_ECOLX|nr:AlpA family transcriptional regulator [Escherichia coli O104:H4]ATG08323.1 AlpA family phage regulatory protein [Escherichia coli]EAA0704246.1 AlpA family transcriptional regulator [Shigella boydii]EGD6247152.1 AlpA family transcriptional regulator [Shigella flexneri]MVD51929.1 AlpA family transcriptional regulator [Proteus mirabilis]OWV42488.1 transcriptional regulator [Klebsiella pneumoniae]OYK51561.1 AlpA family phage regulatory protein [Shigella sonnei]PLA31240.1 AlpA family transcrip
MRKHRFVTTTRHTGTAQPPQPPRLSPGGHIPDYFLRFSPVVMPVKVVRCFHDHTGWFNNIRRNILMTTPVSLMDDQMVDMAFITQLTGLTDKWFYKLIKDGAFPAPIKLGRSSRWLKSEVEAWLQARIAQSRP